MDTLDYKMGWLVVMFDLPTLTADDRKHAARFRNDLIEEGYLMIQYSVYARACVTHDRVLTHTRRLKHFLPPKGRVRCLFVTNIQWQKTFMFYGDDPPDDPGPEQLPQQLLLW